MHPLSPFMLDHLTPAKTNLKVFLVKYEPSPLPGP